MTEAKKPVWHLILILVWYALLLLGSGAVAVFGLAFGSEAYRDKPIPPAELAFIFGPLVFTAIFLAATLYCWTTKRHRAAYLLSGISIIAVFALPSIVGLGFAL